MVYTSTVGANLYAEPVFPVRLELDTIGPSMQVQGLEMGTRVGPNSYENP